MTLAQGLPLTNNLHAKQIKCNPPSPIPSHANSRRHHTFETTLSQQWPWHKRLTLTDDLHPKHTRNNPPTKPHPIYSHTTHVGTAPLREPLHLSDDLAQGLPLAVGPQFDAMRSALLLHRSLADIKGLSGLLDGQMETLKVKGAGRMEVGCVGYVGVFEIGQVPSALRGLWWLARPASGKS